MIGILEYEIKTSYARNIGAYLIYTFIACILMVFFSDYEIINKSAFIFGILAVSIITFLRIFKQFNKNIYGSRGYLIFTPNNEGSIKSGGSTNSGGGKSLLLSKLIPDLIWMFTLALIMASIVIVLIFSYSDVSYMEDVRNFYRTNKVYTIMYLMEYLLNMFRSVFVMYFSICISKLPIWGKNGVIEGFGTYIIIEIFNLIPLLFLKDVAEYVKTTGGFYVLVREYSINNLLIWYVMDLIVFGLVLYITSRLLYNKKTLKNVIN
ncbi:MAG: hypothetical protein ACREVX_10660 [Clostridium sp.]|uniref:hypothetical protein n=1 Tax=Clostridium sp. TaxID=1506 RepID=UPI003D6D3613